MTRDSFIVYRSFIEALDDLPDENQLEIYKAISKYSLDFKEPELSGLSATIFKLIKPQLEANNKRYVNGSKAKRKQNGSKTEANKNVNVNDNVNNNNNKNKEFTFTLKRLTAFENLSQEYKDKLKEHINSKFGMSYDEFETNCIMRDYKYKNYKLAYDKWNKDAKDINPTGAIPAKLIGTKFRNVYGEICEFEADGYRKPDGGLITNPDNIRDAISRVGA